MADIALPSGTVTFLFTDVAVSTRLWEQEPDAMRVAMARHDELVRRAIELHGGFVVKGRGDGVHAVFATADAALRAAVDCQHAMGAEAWPVSEPLRVRIGIHTGVADLRDGDYFGSAVNRAARLEAIAHGGQVVCSQATADLARDALPEEFTLVDLGEHRLRDLSRPERVFQVNAPGLDATFGRLGSLDAFPGNLPVQVSSFVGREQDVERVGHALEASPVVTLTGVGGVGKTRLALQVAAEVLPRFPDGAWLCELAAVRDPDAVVDAAANAFRVTARPGMSLQESLIAYLREQELLMVLDNCEHVLRPVATLVTAIEAACPKVRVLATSREGLNVRGEQILVVPSLTVPDNAVDLDALGGCEAVRLFVDRARAVKADFAVDAANAEGVAQVCRRLDGVPLAIELAAARVTTMNPGELARRLDRRFRLLTGGERVAIERHQTLRATIDWSYDLLTEPEQRLLDRLSVFVGGCTLEAAEGVGAGDPLDVDDVYELLANLVARSLVVVDDTGVDTRYRLLETIRQYGEERLVETGDADELRARHCDYYSEFAGAVLPRSYGPGQIEWGARLAREHDNLVAAMAFALGAEDLERAMRLLCRLPYMQVDRVVIFDAEPVLALVGAADHPGCAVALMVAGVQAVWRGDDQRALQRCDEAFLAEHRLGPVPDSHLAMRGSMLRSIVALDAGAQREAADLALESAGRARADDLPVMTAIHLGTAANILTWLDPTAALPLATEGLELARQTGAPIAIAANLVAGAQALALDDPPKARILLDEALELAATLGYENITELNASVFAAARLGVWPAALRTAGRALHHQLLAGGTGPLFLAGMVNLVARGLAADRPEPAAVLQGAVGVVLRRIAAGPVASDPGSASPSPVIAFIAEARHEATEILVAVLGDERMRELRARGATMDEDQVYIYARRHIDEYLATMDAING